MGYLSGGVVTSLNTGAFDHAATVASADLGAVVHVWMTESSTRAIRTAGRQSAIAWVTRFAKLYIGTATPDGKFHDVVRHTADRAQSNTICSSVDPWHDGAVMNNLKISRIRSFSPVAYPGIASDDSSRDDLRQSRERRCRDRPVGEARVSHFLRRDEEWTANILCRRMPRCIYSSPRCANRIKLKLGGPFSKA